MTAEKKKILVAMSGGVDSSVAAALLAEQGHDVIGVTLRLLPRGGEGFGCCGSPDDLLLAKRSAEKAGVPHYVLDYSPQFEEKVINYFVNSYIAGETPNPCLACNRFIKFDKLKTFGETLGVTHLATGHYAQIYSDGPAHAPHRLFEAIDPTKDQSYVLFNFNQDGLAHTLFPVGHAPKTQIRDWARKFGLPNAEKKDSQEICFVPKKDYRAFVENKLKERGEKATTAQPGPIKDLDGKTIGRHKGVAFYTIGQRSGLDLTSNNRMYVTDLEANSNTLVVGPDQEGASAGLEANDFNWIAGSPQSDTFTAHAKIRYKHEPAPATVTVTAKGVQIRFETPQRAVTPGQAVVLYRWDDKKSAREVLGGGKITQAIKK